MVPKVKGSDWRMHGLTAISNSTTVFLEVELVKEYPVTVGDILITNAIGLLGLY